MKLGGSVLTDKARYRTPRLDVLGRLAHELSTAPGPLVVVHGAGSYGHVVARTYGLAKGEGEPQHAAQAHADVRELAQLVLAALHQTRLAAVWLSPFGAATLREGVLESYDPAPVRAALDAGFTPVLGGDVALDRARRWGILSGDVLMVELAKALRPERAVFVTDVDGIHDAWPGGALLRRIGPKDEPFAGASPHADVTGGMAGKLARARQVAQHAPVTIVNGMVAGRLADALAGKDVAGTIVE